MLKTAMFRTIFGIAALLLVTSTARATLYNGSYTVTANSNPAIGLAVMTINDFGSVVNATTNSFTGLNVPATGLHFTDLFELFALDTKLDVRPTADAFETRTNVVRAMQGHILGKAVYGGLFRRPQ